MVKRIRIMTNRENILTGLRRRQPERVGYDFMLCPEQIDRFRSETGQEDLAAYFDFPTRSVEPRPTRLSPDFSRYYDSLPEGTRPLDWNPEWGVMGAPGSTAHFQEMLHPMERMEDPSELEDYPWPDFDADYRWEGVAEQVADLKRKDLVALGFLEMTNFEMAWYLRGMENLMVDLMEGSPFAEELLDRVTASREAHACRFAEAGVDVLMLGDDIATQVDMMLSPDLWRRTIKPRLARVINQARQVRSDLLILYHGDGNMRTVIPDLIEVGVDILNPVQPECLDPYEMKREFGRDLAFWGCLGTQTTLPFGTPESIRETCLKLISEVGKGGGLLLAPTHLIEPDVPWENIMAFVDAVREQ